MSDQRFWIIARLEGDTLDLSLAGSAIYLDDDPVHRTREATTVLKLLDPDALRSARALLVPSNPRLDPEQLAIRRDDAIIDPARLDLTRLRDDLQGIMNTYRSAMGQLLRRAVANSESAAFLHDAYDGDGKAVDTTEAPSSAPPGVRIAATTRPRGASRFDKIFGG